jgi:hypothetical protein
MSATPKASCAPVAAQARAGINAAGAPGLSCPVYCVKWTKSPQAPFFVPEGPETETVRDRDQKRPAHCEAQEGRSIPPHAANHDATSGGRPRAPTAAGSCSRLLGGCSARATDGPKPCMASTPTEIVLRGNALPWG